MNIKNFPKTLNSKTSCFRITVPENLDLALEGLIRKVLKEQPKIDDIYAFAADYFDMLLKIRDKVGTKFGLEQICPFHNDEDAHEMIKLANTFAKPEKLKSKTFKVDSKDTKGNGKKLLKLTKKSEKALKNSKAPVVFQKKLERSSREKKDQKLNESKAERLQKLKLEPNTEDVGEDEEFLLKLDPIKILVEKELMDVAKFQPKDHEEEGENEVRMLQKNVLKEAVANEELYRVVNIDNTETEEKKSDEINSKTKGEKTQLLDAAKDKEKEITAEEKKPIEAREMEIQDEKKERRPVEVITEALNSKKDSSSEIKKALWHNTEDRQRSEIQDSNLEIKSDNDHIKTMEIFATSKETLEHLENKVKAEEGNEDIVETETNQKALKERVVAEDITAEKLLEEKIELESMEKDIIKPEALDILEKKLTKESPIIEEINPNFEELCTVVDVLSINNLEKEKTITEQLEEAKVEESKFTCEERVNEGKIKADVALFDKEKEVETQKPVKGVEPTFADKKEERNINENLDQTNVNRNDDFISGAVKNIQGQQYSVNSIEKLKEQAESESNKFYIELTLIENEVKKIVSEEAESVLSENTYSISPHPEDKKDNEATQKINVIRDDPVSKVTMEKDSEGMVVVEKKFHPEGILIESSENKVYRTVVEKTEAIKVIEKEDTKFEKNSEIEEDTRKQFKSEIETRESIQDYENIRDNEGDSNVGETNSAVNEKKTPEEPPNVKEKLYNVAEVTKQPKTERELEVEEPKLKDDKKEVECEVNDTEKEKDNGVFEGKAEVLKILNIVEKADHAVETVLKDSEKKKHLLSQKSVKPVDELRELVTTETNAVELSDKLEKNKISEIHANQPAPDLTTLELFEVVDAQHVIKVEKADESLEAILLPEGVQIKTIQTHYYDTLQVPEEISKEYRVHTVNSDSVMENLLKITNTDLLFGKRKVVETPEAPLDVPNRELDKSDLENLLQTTSSDYFLNLSELSVQSITEKFLDKEKKYNSLVREERRCAIKMSPKCGGPEKREVEEIIHKTMVPSTVGATPLTPRDDAEIKEETNIESDKKNEKKKESSKDLSDLAKSLNDARSIESDSQVISVEVKTVIEARVLENAESEKDGDRQTEEGGSELEIEIEATIDVPEGVVLDTKKEKKNNDEDEEQASAEPPNSETVAKNSQTFSEESESTISSSGTEIKKSDFTQRPFSSTRTLITTQSLDFEKRNPLLKTRSLSSFRQGMTDFEVWNAIVKELEEAATKIQSGFRGYKTRKKLQREDAVQITTEESSCSTTPVEPESSEEKQQGTGEFHDSIVLSEHPR